MPPCAVLKCKYDSRRDGGAGKKRTLFTFPKDPRQSAIWRKKCGRDSKFNTEHGRVCSKHFTEDSYIRNLRNELLGIVDKMRRRLKPDAVPTLHLPFEDTEKNIKRAERVAARKWKVEKDAIIKEILSNELAKAEKPEVNMEPEPEQMMEIPSANEEGNLQLESLEIEVLMNVPSEEISPPKEIIPPVTKKKSTPEVGKKLQAQLTTIKPTDIPNHFIPSVHKTSETNDTERSTRFAEHCKNCARMKLQNDGRRVRIFGLEREVTELKRQLSLAQYELAKERESSKSSLRCGLKQIKLNCN